VKLQNSRRLEAQGASRDIPTELCDRLTSRYFQAFDVARWHGWTSVLTSQNSVPRDRTCTGHHDCFHGPRAIMILCDVIEINVL
jgi:hypothetical protein